MNKRFISCVREKKTAGQKTRRTQHYQEYVQPFCCSCIQPAASPHEILCITIGSEKNLLIFSEYSLDKVAIS